MKRRDAVALLGFLSLGGVVTLWRNLFALGQPDASQHVTHTLAAVTDLMFPGDGLPAATELGIHHRILAMPDLRVLIAKGVAWLDDRARLQGASDFLGLNETDRLATVDAAFASPDGDSQQFILTLRYHLGMAYYAEPVVKAAFAYTGPPQPDGFADFQDRPA
jgi:hypothetical protein